MKEASARIENLLASGGRERIALLRYCVLSVTMEPLFVFLAREYRLRPGHAAALALFDLFCQPRAPAPLRSSLLGSPAALGLQAAIATLRRQWSQLQAAEPPDPESAVPITVPLRGLFDPLVQSLVDDAQGPLARLGERYDPALDPLENLHGRRMTSAQALFVERVWKPLVRPQLVAAGFWQLRNIE